MRLYDNLPELTDPEKMTSKPNVVFDLYGTLVDIHTDEENKNFWKKFAKYLRKQGMSYNYKSARAVYIGLCALHTTELQNKKPGSKVEIELRDVFYRMCRIARPSATRQEADKVGRYFRKLSTSYIRVYEDVFPMLDGLRAQGKKIWLLSNAQALFTLPELDMLGLTEYFDGIAISSDVGVKKPDPEFAKYLFDKYSLKAEDCIMVGNEKASDVAVAINSGMEHIFVRSNLTPADEL